MKNLILSRRVKEQVVIGGCVVTILAATRRNVRLSILADEGTTVDRGEVHVRKGGTIPQREEGQQC